MSRRQECNGSCEVACLDCQDVLQPEVVTWLAEMSAPSVSLCHILSVKLQCVKPCSDVQARQALDVVSSLVEDLAPPDSVSRPNRPDDAVHSGSQEHKQQQDMPGAEAEAQGRAASSAADKAAKGGTKTREKAAKDAAATARVSADKAAIAAAKVGQKDADRAPEEDRAARGGAKTKGKNAKEASGTARAPAGKTATATAQANQQGTDRIPEVDKAANHGAGARNYKAKRTSDAAPGDEPGKAEAKKKGPAKAWDADALPAEDAAAGSPEQGGAAGRPFRRRASKAPWWMGQVCNVLLLCVVDE